MIRSTGEPVRLDDLDDVELTRRCRWWKLCSGSEIDALSRALAPGAGVVSSSAARSPWRREAAGPLLQWYPCWLENWVSEVEVLKGSWVTSVDSGCIKR